MRLDDFAQKKCNSGKNTQFMPKGFLRIDLERAALLLAKAGAVIEVETTSLLIIRLDGTQLDLNASGKTVAKTEDWERAKKLFLEILPLLSKAKK